MLRATGDGHEAIGVEGSGRGGVRRADRTQERITGAVGMSMDERKPRNSDREAQVETGKVSDALEGSQRGDRGTAAVADGRGIVPEEGHAKAIG